MVAKRYQIEREALQSMARGDWARAIELYESVLKEEKDPNIFNIVGDLYLRAGKANEAAQNYRFAIEGFLQEEMFNSASAVVRKLLRLNASDLFALISQAKIAFHQGIYRESLEYIRKALENGLKEHQAYMSEVLELLKQMAGQGNEVLLQEIRELLATFGVQDTEILEILKQPEQEEGGEIPISKQGGTSYDPDFLYLLHELDHTLAQGVEVSTRPSLSRAHALFDMGLYRSAILEYQNYLAEHPEDLEALLMLGKAFLKAGEADLALRAFEEGVSRAVGREKLMFQYWIARTHEALGERDEAIKIYREILFKDMNFMDVKRRLELLSGRGGVRTKGGSRATKRRRKI